MARSTRYSLRNSRDFLQNPELARDLVARSGIGADDVVVEIGSGKGIIMDVLVQKARHVLAIEADTSLIAS